jgi:hypothetical protein
MGLKQKAKGAASGFCFHSLNSLSRIEAQKIVQQQIL